MYTIPIDEKGSLVSAEQLKHGLDIADELKKELEASEKAITDLNLPIKVPQSPDVFDLDKAKEVFEKYAVYSQTRKSLVRAFPQPLSAVIEKICCYLKSGSANDEAIKACWLVLGFVVGKSRYALCPGLTALINSQCE